MPIENICLSNSTHEVIFFGEDGMSYASQITYEIHFDRIVFSGDADKMIKIVPLPVRLDELSLGSGRLVLDYHQPCVNLDFDDADDALPLLSCKLGAAASDDKVTHLGLIMLFSSLLGFAVLGVMIWFGFVYHRWTDDLKLKAHEIKTDKVPKFDVFKGKAMLSAYVRGRNIGQPPSRTGDQ
uniref:Cadherin domain-containing protein n=1 Tax=Steinernema glaseri TaxID=37863 RepID=A0A1I7YBC3_9BILA